MLDYMIGAMARTLGSTIIVLPIILLVRGSLLIRLVVGAVLGGAPSGFFAWIGDTSINFEDHVMRIALGVMIGLITALIVWVAHRNVKNEPPSQPWR